MFTLHCFIDFSSCDYRNLAQAESDSNHKAEPPILLDSRYLIPEITKQNIIAQYWSRTAQSL